MGQPKEVESKCVGLFTTDVRFTLLDGSKGIATIKSRVSYGEIFSDASSERTTIDESSDSEHVINRTNTYTQICVGWFKERGYSNPSFGPLAEEKFANAIASLKVKDSE